MQEREASKKRPIFLTYTFCSLLILHRVQTPITRHDTLEQAPFLGGHLRAASGIGLGPLQRDRSSQVFSTIRTPAMIGIAR